MLQTTRSHPLVAPTLMMVRLPDTRSQLVQRNDGRIYCCRYANLNGLFRKDREPSLRFGRMVCDQVRVQMGNQGFFTSDELPRYGLSRGDLRTILQGTHADPAHDLVAIFAYGHDETERTKQTLDVLLAQYVVQRNGQA